MTMEGHGRHSMETVVSVDSVTIIVNRRSFNGESDHHRHRCPLWLGQAPLYGMLWLLFATRSHRWLSCPLVGIVDTSSNGDYADYTSHSGNGGCVGNGLPQ